MQTFSPVLLMHAIGENEFFLPSERFATPVRVTHVIGEIKIGEIKIGKSFVTIRSTSQGQTFSHAQISAYMVSKNDWLLNKKVTFNSHSSIFIHTCTCKY